MYRKGRSEGKALKGRREEREKVLCLFLFLGFCLVVGVFWIERRREAAVLWIGRGERES